MTSNPKGFYRSEVPRLNVFSTQIYVFQPVDPPFKAFKLEKIGTVKSSEKSSEKGSVDDSVKSSN